jgi:transcriptional regulator with XRE-family HTH domain
MNARNFAGTFGATLAEARSERRLSQENLCEIAEFDRTYASLIKRGLRQPKLTFFLRLCAVLGQTPEHMLKRTLAKLDGKTSSEVPANRNHIESSD